jgi:hypothetical protein
MPTSAALGVQENLPVEWSKIALEGNPETVKATVSPTSGSVAFTTNTIGEPTVTVSEPGTLSDGGLFCGGAIILIVTVMECWREPLSAVTWTLYDPGLALEGVVTVRVRPTDPPEESVKLVWLKDAVSAPLPVSLSETVPLNPLTLEIVIVDVPDWPVWIVSEFADADIEKSGGGGTDTVSEMWSWCEVDPLVALTIKSYSPAGVDEFVDIVRVDVAVPPDTRFKLVGFRLVDGPGVDTVAFIRTVPEKPLMLASWTLAEPELPIIRVRLLVFDAIEKSGESGEETVTV